IALWLLGYPEATLSDSDNALKNARATGQAATLMYALVHAPFTHFWSGNYAAANTQIEEGLALADEKGASLWQAMGMMNQGGVLALTGNAANAIQMLTSGISALRSTGSTLWMPLYLPYLARAYAERAQFDDAW